MTTKPRATSAKAKAKAEPEPEVDPIEVDVDPMTPASTLLPGYTDGSAPAEPVPGDVDAAALVRGSLDQLAMQLVGSNTSISGEQIADVTEANADIAVVVYAPDPDADDGDK
jgi:hypothetical protein